MAKHNKVRSVTIHYPTAENEEEFQHRASRAVAKVLCETYPPEVIDQIIEALERNKNAES